jgi:putative peptide zinc metalloprotease protein
MGITFILLFPLPYTDTTNSWKLSDHNQRLKIASAGIVSEFVLALWSTFLWKVSPEGALQNAFFFVATTTWISSLIINASPFMRFDGYFLLMDFLKIPNLHARSTAMAKWWIRELLFKLNIQAPEIFSANMKVFLIIFAVTTWIYRFFVFLALALLVYHFFVKAIGVILFLIEIYIFIIRPVYLEARVWWNMRRNIVETRRVIFVLMALCLFGVFIAWPTKERHVVPALYMPYQEVTVYSPESGRVLSMPIDVGDDLEEGERLISLYSERIDYELRVAELAVSTAERDIQSENLSTGGIGLSGRNEAWSSALARLEALESEKQNLDVRAPMTGIVTEVFGEFHVNAFVSEGTPILRIQGEDKNQLRTYILENERSALKIGDQVSFFFNALPSQTFFARVSYISNVSTKALAYPELSSVNNGPMVSVETEGGYELDRQMFEAHFQVETPHQFTNRLPVTLNFSGDKQSYLLNLLQRAINLLIREFGA